MVRNSFLLGTAGLGLLLLGACSSSQPPTSTSSASPSANPVASASAAATGKSTAAGHNDSHKSASGLVVESGPYHLELVPSKEEGGLHLDLFLQKGDNHEAIPGAKVSAQVQLPDGRQETIDLPYDAAGKHYAGKVSGGAAGDYKVTIQSDIAGEKVNARYAFKQ
jgi:hypothetical protein